MKIRLKIIDTKNKRSIKMLQNFMLLLFFISLVLYLIIGITLEKNKGLLGIIFLFIVLSLTLFILCALTFYLYKIKFIGKALIDVKANRITITFSNKIITEDIQNVSFILNGFPSEEMLSTRFKKIPIYNNYIIFSEIEKYEFHPSFELNEIEKIISIKYTRNNWLEGKTSILFKDSLKLISSVFYD